MSEVEDREIPAGLPDEEPALDEPMVPAGSSLKARMHDRQEELAKRTTELFPVPRYDEIIAVELKAIPWERSEKILERHQRQAKRMMLNSSADELVAATVGFWEIKEDGSTEEITDVSRWSEVCEHVLEVDLPNSPPATLERVGLLTLCSDQGVMALNGQYRRWLGGANVGIGEEVGRDFSSTP